MHATLRTRVIAVCTLVVLAAACGKKDESAPAAKGKQEPAAGARKEKLPEPTKPAPDWSAWDPAGKAKAWTGSWVALENGSYQAWTVAADGTVQVQEQDKASTYKLEVEIPCYAYFVGDGGIKYPRPFTVTADGKLRSSGSGGGYIKGGEAIFCDASGTIYLLGADGKCTAWQHGFEWKQIPGECGLGQNADGKPVFKHGEPNGGEFLIEGDAIIAGRHPTDPAADHEAAMKLAGEKNAAK